MGFLFSSFLRGVRFIGSFLFTSTVTVQINNSNDSAHRYRISLFTQNLHYFPRYRRRYFRTHFGSVYFKKHIVFLNRLTYLYRPRNNCSFGYTLAQLRHFYFEF